ncbi:MAG: hypothetical protein ACRD2A_06770, partial [Vicinamibacterales bacterium]
ELDLGPIQEESERQRTATQASVADNPQLQSMVAELERVYDSERPAQSVEEADGAPLSPELEGFLKDVQTRLEDGG